MMSRLHPAAAWRQSGLARPPGHRWTRTVAAGAAALALAGCGGLPPQAGASAGHGATVASASASASSAAASAPRAGARAAAPRFFADLVLGEQGGQSPLQVRESATGRLVAQDLSVRATGLAALADGRTFVLAEPVGQSCATRLYRVRLNGRGQPGALSPLPVPVLPGELYSLTASGTGNVLGYAISGCSKGDLGYIGVVHVRSGRTTRWGDVELGGISPGSVGLNGELSLSANGRLLAFPAFGLSANSTIISKGVRVLPVNASPGTIAQRSRLERAGSYPPFLPLLASAVLSPGGRTFYRCTLLRQSQHAVRIAADRSSTGRRRRALARLTVTGMPPAGGCPMALDGPGKHLLVPYCPLLAESRGSPEAAHRRGDHFHRAGKDPESQAARRRHATRRRIAHRLVSLPAGQRASRQMCTIGQVRVLVMPSTDWICATTSLPRSSTLSACARTITS